VKVSELVTAVTAVLATKVAPVAETSTFMALI
jgi:hypothetical protein